MKKKCLVIYRLTMPAMFYIFVRRLFGECDVYYMDMKSEYRKTKRVKELEGRDIKWIKREYKEFSQYLKSMFDAVSYAEIIYEKVRFSHLNSALSDILVKNESHRQKMDVFWKYYVYRMVLPFAEQFAAAGYLLNTGRYTDVRVIAFNSLASLLKETLDNTIKVKIFPGLDFYKGYTRILKDYSRSFLKKGINYFQSSCTKRETAPEGVYETSPHLKDVESYEVIYFPHQGVFYSDLFKKDHFYSDDPASLLYPSKILHISLGEKNEYYMKENYEYYKQNGIPYTDLYDIHVGHQKATNKVWNIIRRLNVKLISDIRQYKFWYIMYVLYLYATVERYRSLFSLFKDLKVVLIGYDHLFPRYLAFALATMGPKVCATQERLIFAYWPDNYYMFDYYFVAGRAAKEEGLKSSFIDHCIPVGMMREDTLFEYEIRQIYDTKYDSIKKEKKLILALDYHMPDDEIEDANRQAAKIHQTRQFYRDLIRLSRELPSIHIVVKGKIADLYKSSFIEDLIKEIDSLNNIEIELDLKKYNPYYVSEKADLTIACHTSLADELLAAGRKVIFYETTDLMETLLEYDRLPIIVKDYDGLRQNVDNFLNGFYIADEKIKELQEKYYADCYHGKTQKAVQRMIERIHKDGCLLDKDVEIILRNARAKGMNEV